jgi:hypothetical protein
MVKVVEKEPRRVPRRDDAIKFFIDFLYFSGSRPKMHFQWKFCDVVSSGGVLLEICFPSCYHQVFLTVRELFVTHIQFFLSRSVKLNHFRRFALPCSFHRSTSKQCHINLSVD